jgi:hypothetical protein
MRIYSHAAMFVAISKSRNGAAYDTSALHASRVNGPNVSVLHNDRYKPLVFIKVAYIRCNKECVEMP